MAQSEMTTGQIAAQFLAAVARYSDHSKVGQRLSMDTAELDDSMCWTSD